MADDKMSMIVFGDKNTGKTCLMKLLTNNAFHISGISNYEIDPNLGNSAEKISIREIKEIVDYISFEYKENFVISKHEANELEQYEDLIRSSRLALLCFSPELPNSVKYITKTVLPYLEKRNRKCFKILLMLKSDLLSDPFMLHTMENLKEKMIDDEIAAALVESIKPSAYFKCSAYNNEGIGRIQQVVVNCVVLSKYLSALPDMHDQWLEMVEYNSILNHLT